MTVVTVIHSISCNGKGMRERKVMITRKICVLMDYQVMDSQCRGCNPITEVTR